MSGLTLAEKQLLLKQRNENIQRIKQEQHDEYMRKKLNLESGQKTIPYDVNTIFIPNNNEKKSPPLVQTRIPYDINTLFAPKKRALEDYSGKLVQSVLEFKKRKEDEIIESSSTTKNTILQFSKTKEASIQKTKEIESQKALLKQKKDPHEDETIDEELFKNVNVYIHSKEEIDALCQFVHMDFLTPDILPDEIEAPIAKEKQWVDPNDPRFVDEAYQRYLEYMEQNDVTWSLTRGGRTGASEFATTIGLGDHLTIMDQYERDTGKRAVLHEDPEDVYFKERGHIREDEPMKIWEAIVKPKNNQILTKGMFINVEKNPYSHASPDGFYIWNGYLILNKYTAFDGENILVEIKNPFKDTYEFKEHPKIKALRNSKKKEIIQHVKKQKEQMKDDSPLDMVQIQKLALSVVPYQYDESKGEHFSNKVPYVVQQMVQIDMIMQRLKANVNELLCYWSFDDKCMPIYDEESKLFLIAKLQVTRYYRNDEFMKIAHEKHRYYVECCKNKTPPEIVDRDDLLSHFPKIRCCPILEVKFWLEPRKDEQGNCIYGPLDENQKPTPEIRYGTCKKLGDKLVPLELIGKKVCKGITYMNTKPRYISMKEFDTHCMDPNMSVYHMN
jgi:hypothetical protein